jgi:hypothetical protein
MAPIAHVHRGGSGRVPKYLTFSAVDEVPLRDAAGRTLAEEVAADFAMPPFEQSAMDGYAVALGGGMLPAGARLPLGRVAAGEKACPLLGASAAGSSPALRCLCPPMPCSCRNTDGAIASVQSTGRLSLLIVPDQTSLRFA